MVLSFAAFKEAAESRGLKVIPFIETLSHVHNLIALDPSISEFADWRGFCAGTGVPCGYGHDHITALADSDG